MISNSKGHGHAGTSGTSADMHTIHGGGFVNILIRVLGIDAMPAPADGPVWQGDDFSQFGKNQFVEVNPAQRLTAQRSLADFLAANQVEVVASLPYFQTSQTDAQRGHGVFEKSIEALRLLNRLGYGHPDSSLVLNLVYNPIGAFLPPAQSAIEGRFKKELCNRYGVVFNHLYTIANMPISRFLEFLIESGNYEGYMERLANAFNPAAATSVMCRYTLSVAWDGTRYDCDFNQMLGLPMAWKGKPRTHLRELMNADLMGNPILVKDHCYGCTAGQGSSCSGALVG